MRFDECPMFLTGSPSESECPFYYLSTKYPVPLLLQGYVPVLDDDTADRLAGRVIAAQQILAPQAIQLIDRAYWSNNAAPQTKHKAS